MEQLAQIVTLVPLFHKSYMPTKIWICSGCTEDGLKKNLHMYINIGLFDFKKSMCVSA